MQEYVTHFGESPEDYNELPIELETVSTANTVYVGCFLRDSWPDPHIVGCARW
jgi:hypothetical protein